MQESIKEKHEKRAKLYFEIGQIKEAINKFEEEIKTRLVQCHNLQVDIEKLEKRELRLAEPSDAIQPEVMQ